MRKVWRLRGSAPDVASCKEAMRRLQAYLDGEITDELSARRIAAHLDVCRDCGLEARTLAELKPSLRRLASDIDPVVVERLRSFARRLDEP